MSRKNVTRTTTTVEDIDADGNVKRRVTTEEKARVKIPTEEIIQALRDRGYGIELNATIYSDNDYGDACDHIHVEWSRTTITEE